MMRSVSPEADFRINDNRVVVIAQDVLERRSARFPGPHVHIKRSGQSGNPGLGRLPRYMVCCIDLQLQRFGPSGMSLA
jgi:hypothetical protein